MTSWGAIYDRGTAAYAAVLEPTFTAHAERVVELAQAGPGTRLLDVATGTGTIARLAAARGAAVVGVDVSKRMVEIGRKLAPDLDLRVADASALPFPDVAFDVVTCGLAVTHFVDLDAALSEARRVLRPGGRFVASAWAEDATNAARTVASLVDRYVAPAEDLDERSWAIRERGCELLRRAGFTDVSGETWSCGCTFADADEALAWIVASPVTASRLARVAPEERDRLYAEARSALAGARLAGRLAFTIYVATA